jgi:translocation and assembly module TamB
LQPLAEHLPAQVSITADAFKASPELPDTLQVNQLVLTAKGDLKDGYVLDGSASLPAETAPVRVLLKGRVDATGAQVSALI